MSRGEILDVRQVQRTRIIPREYVSAPGAPGKVFPRFGVAPGVGVKDSHSWVWPLEWSVTRKRGILFEVGGHGGAYKGRVHVIVPFVGRKNGKIFDCQQSYNVLVLRVPGLEEGLKHCDRWPERSFGCWARRARAGQTYPPKDGGL